MSKVLPFLSLLLAACIVAFGAGVFVTEFKVPPYRTIAEGAKTLRYSWRALKAPPYIGQFMRTDPDLAAADAAGARLETGAEGAALPGTLLITGGLNEYREYCPGDGCLAIEIDRAGNLVQAWPYLPEVIFAADTVGAEFYREAVPADPRHIHRPIGVQKFPGGDLLVSFQSAGAMFPYSGGLARIAPDGTPRWFRFDYSHHWATLEGDRIYVPDLFLREGDWEVRVGPKDGRLWSFYCESGKPYVDGVQILDTDGNVIRRIDLAESLRASRWAPVLAEAWDPCDPMHINFVDVLDETAPGGALQPGYLLVSMRNLDAVIVVDPETGAVTEMIRGSFMQQHSVHQLDGSRALVFDNWGAAGPGGSSRLLEIDLAGGPERQIFPPADAPDDLAHIFSDRAGNIDIAPDRSRALVAFTYAGKGFEVDLETGEPLLTYRALHDLSGLEAAGDQRQSQASTAKLFGMYYVPAP